MDYYHHGLHCGPELVLESVHEDGFQRRSRSCKRPNNTSIPHRLHRRPSNDRLLTGPLKRTRTQRAAVGFVTSNSRSGQGTVCRFIRHLRPNGSDDRTRSARGMWYYLANHKGAIAVDRAFNDHGAASVSRTIWTTIYFGESGIDAF